MTILIKDAVIEVIVGRKGRDYAPAIPGTPAKPGYYTYQTVKVYNATITNSTSSHATQITITPPSVLEDPSILDGQNAMIVKEASMATLRLYMPTLRSLIDAINTSYENGDDTYMDAEPDKENPVDPRAIRFKKAWDDFQDERERILQAEVDTGTLGRPLAYLSSTWGANAYIAAFDGTGVAGVNQPGVTFFTFQGFAVDDRPSQIILK